MILKHESKRLVATLVLMLCLVCIALVGVEVTNHRGPTHPLAPPPFATQGEIPMGKSAPPCVAALVALEDIVTEGTVGKQLLLQGIVALKNGAYTQYNIYDLKSTAISTKLREVNIPAYLKLRQACIDGL